MTSSCGLGTIITAWMFVLLVVCVAIFAVALIQVIKHLQRMQGSGTVAESLSLLLLSGGGQISKELYAIRFLLRREYANVGVRELRVVGDRARACLFAGLILFVVFMLAAVASQSLFEYRCLIPASSMRRQ